MASRTSTRRRMIDSAVTLLREQGAAGVTIDAVLAHSGAPRGSVYHHFPGGRAELLLTAGRTASDVITELVRDAAQVGDPVSVVERLVDFWKASLEATDYRAGCPIVALAVGGRPDLTGGADLVRETFDRWRAQLAELLAERGSDPDDAAALATFAIAAIEGAVILCRSERSAEPLDQVFTRLLPLLSD